MNNIDLLQENEIIDGVLAEFAELAKIPRPSGHEKAVSDYLCGLFEAMGCKVVQDEVLNIIADMPAAKGCEAKPLTVMQAHMDMVCVAEEGKEYDAVHDAIKLVREGDLLHADGTSLGADDGIGIAAIVFVMKNLSEHGPLRAIITVDEETGMTGSMNLAKEHFADVEYLINCDSEDWDLLTVGSAGSGDINFYKHYELTEYNKAGKAYTVTLQGLKGGHSGEEINCGAANALQSIAFCLDKLRKGLPDFCLAGINGGRAKNVIPSKAEAVFCTNADKEAVEELLDEAFEEFMGIYGDVEVKAVLTLTDVPATKSGMDKKTGESFLDLLLSIPNGVSSMSQVCAGMVEASANIGVVKTDFDKQELEIQYMPRSSREELIQNYYAKAEALARMSGFEVALGTMFPSWKEQKNNKLADIMQQVFTEQNNQPMRISSIHAGLECSWHLQRNPAMYVVSIGTNNNDIHSPKETLELKTIPPQVKLMAETLRRICKYA